MIKEVIRSKDGVFVLTWHEKKNFSKIKPITQVYGVCFDKKGRILIVNVEGNDKWQLIGGHPEKGETFEETLKREALEEGDIEICDLKPLGYQKVWNKEKKSAIYQLRYFARVSKVKKQTIDPAEGKILERKFILPSQFLKYCPWGKIGKVIIRKAVKEYRSLQKL